MKFIIVFFLTKSDVFLKVVFFVDIDECQNSSCVNTSTEMCIDEVNGYTCNCSQHYGGQYCENGEKFSGIYFQKGLWEYDLNSANIEVGFMQT